MPNYETVAVVMEIAKERTGATTCRLKPIAGPSAIEIGGHKYLVGVPAHSSEKCNTAVLWRLDSYGLTETEFQLKVLKSWACAASVAQRKVRLVVEVDKVPDPTTNIITKITLT